MVSLLLLWGADTNARDRKKRTPEQIIGGYCIAVLCRLTVSQCGVSDPHSGDLDG